MEAARGMPYRLDCPELVSYELKVIALPLALCTVYSKFAQQKVIIQIPPAVPGRHSGP